MALKVILEARTFHSSLRRLLRIQERGILNYVDNIDINIRQWAWFLQGDILERGWAAWSYQGLTKVILVTVGNDNISSVEWICKMMKGGRAEDVRIFDILGAGNVGQVGESLLWRLETSLRWIFWAKQCFQELWAKCLNKKSFLTSIHISEFTTANW